ncbi:MAG: hypothetical protein AVO35_12505 [Candidatus Aegiribacteria sp. MLS_C]|nr:MAG: hypothetical protein AVO35_12505 [Candidatus Aegiribacteria sp. MLS_C]
MNRIIGERLSGFDERTPEFRIQRFRELLQEMAIYSLSAHDFFKEAFFHGGTELRLLHGLPRFSEDLDFLLREPDEGFDWKIYEDKLLATFSRYDIRLEIRRKPREKGTIRAIMLIESSLAVSDSSGRPGYTRIRLEIDTSPPSGATAETGFLDFPVPHEVSVMDLPSSFALKCHALLCRNWMKGRDWFDLLWFCSRNVRPNLRLFSSSMEQTGPWAGQAVPESEDWLVQRLREKVMETDLEQAARDVLPFLRAEERETVRNWSSEMFLHFIDKAF